MEIAGFDEAVRNLVQEHWTNTGRALRLSNLGGVLNREFDLAEITKGAKLASFLRLSPPSGIQLLQSPTDGQVWAAAPAEVGNDEETVRKLFAPTERMSFSNATEGEFPTIQREVWRAFAIPVAEGNKRFLDSKEVKVFEIQPGDTPPTNVTEIERQYIISNDQSSSAAAKIVIQNNISKWCSAHNISISSLVISRPEDQKSSALSAILDALSDEELSRITMPLDLAKKLLKIRNK
jgi:hypothetical protein